MLAEQITADQDAREWSAQEDTADGMEKMDPRATIQLCACCYLEEKQEYMLDAQDCGVKDGDEFHKKYVWQEKWTRCLDCMREASTPACAERGHVPGKNDEHHCEECVGKFDSLMIAKRPLYEKTQGGKKRLMHQNCQTKIDCSKRKTAYETKYWSKSERNSNFEGKRTMLACKPSQGFHPDDLKIYKCQTSAAEFKGHLLQYKVLNNYKYIQREKLRCIQCTAAKRRVLKCSKCKTEYELTYWSRSARRNHSSPKRTYLVCKACRAQGFHPHDLETYTCQTCACKFGARRFNRHQLRHFKYHQRQKLICMQCTAAAEERVQQLRGQLRKSNRKCTCHCRMHKKKCPLDPVIFGERRWPGSDGAISADDRKFLDELNPPPTWWSKAWGR